MESLQRVTRSQNTILLDAAARGYFGNRAQKSQHSSFFFQKLKEFTLQKDDSNHFVPETGDYHLMHFFLRWSFNIQFFYCNIFSHQNISDCIASCQVTPSHFKIKNVCKNCSKLFPYIYQIEFWSEKMKNGILLPYQG